MVEADNFACLVQVRVRKLFSFLVIYYVIRILNNLSSVNYSSKPGIYLRERGIRVDNVGSLGEEANVER